MGREQKTLPGAGAGGRGVGKPPIVADRGGGRKTSGLSLWWKRTRWATRGRSRLYCEPRYRGSTRLRQAHSLLSRIESVPRRELYFFALYRLLEAGILAALLFSPLGEVLGQPRHPELGTAVTIGYLVLALVLFFVGRNVGWLTWIVFASVCIDIVAATLATHALPGATAGIAMMLLFNVSAAALLLPSTRMAAWEAVRKPNASGGAAVSTSRAGSAASKRPPPPSLM